MEGMGGHDADILARGHKPTQAELGWGTRSLWAGDGG
jgi:hypothetical protein